MLFLRNISTNWTSEAMTRMKARVRRYSKPKGFSRNISTTQVMAPARTSTKTTAMAMPMAVSILLETPRNGQFPRYCISRMLLTKMQLDHQKNVITHGSSPCRNPTARQVRSRLFLSQQVHDAQHEAQADEGPGRLDHERKGLK